MSEHVAHARQASLDDAIGLEQYADDAAHQRCAFSRSIDKGGHRIRIERSEKQTPSSNRWSRRDRRAAAQSRPAASQSMSTAAAAAAAGHRQQQCRDANGQPPRVVPDNRQDDGGVVSASPY
jgi:hypothetical protein